MSPEILKKIEARANAANSEPKCPSCGAGVGRPKCMFELDPDECPRHDLARAWRLEVQKFDAHSRADIPALISALREAWAKIAELEKDRGKPVSNLDFSGHNRDQI